MIEKSPSAAHYHLPGLFEFYELYKVFLPLWRGHREYFYDWCNIGSIYGAPSDCLWGGGRAAVLDDNVAVEDVIALMKDYGISARLTFSNSLLTEEHLTDRKCNELCRKFECAGLSTAKPDVAGSANGVIVHSDLLADYLQKKYPALYLVSSTTKVLSDFGELEAELRRPEFRYVVPDFRLNKEFDALGALPLNLKRKVEFLCNECCSFDCRERAVCYENVSRKNLGLDAADHACKAPGGRGGYRFSLAMKNPAFIGVPDIQNTYLPMGFSNFKLEGRGLGSAIVLEFLLYYMTKPEYQLNVREAVYLDSMLDLF